MDLCRGAFGSFYIIHFVHLSSPHLPPPVLARCFCRICVFGTRGGGRVCFGAPRGRWDGRNKAASISLYRKSKSNKSTACQSALICSRGWAVCSVGDEIFLPDDSDLSPQPCCQGEQRRWFQGPFSWSITPGPPSQVALKSQLLSTALLTSP